MSAVLSRGRTMPGVGALLAALGLVALAWFDPANAARGWLAGWVLALSVAVGSAVLLLTHALTGGGWRAAGEPWLTVAAGATPLLALGGTALFAGLGLLYPWADGLSEGSVARIWLNAPSWTLRLVVVLALWAGLGLVARQGPGRGVAAAGLAIHALTVSVAGVDWLLSLDRHFVSTDFGAQLAVTQIGAALALPAALGLAPVAAARADWGGLMLACVLGAFYLAGMQFLVSWSGDLPDKAAWYLARNQGAGLALAWAVFVLGALAPFAILLRTAWRGAERPLRLAGALMLTGAFGHLVWIVAPLSDPAALPALPAALLAVWFLASLARLLYNRGPR